MIDPKMLELSVYDGIPHLLTPVVTDPKKAVVALKWAVREMEDRYKQDVEARRAQHRRLQRAASPRRRPRARSSRARCRPASTDETGEAIYETEELDLEPLPYIVVIVDEMADLMMVAGKDIEGAHPAPGADGARRRHPPHHGDAAPVGRRHHRHDQGELPDPHLASR